MIKNGLYKARKNLFKSLTKDEFSVFYTADKIPNNLLKKARKSYYPKDKVLMKLYNNLDNKIVYMLIRIRKLFYLFILILLNRKKI